ncbi:MAG TPA: site-2 protease family protein [Candidatus Absconditabacterales bacterium]|nr:site-2 protease family protein [Candidatus Absconditabacterales bacterium]HMT26905.1 site-2 protease family protein [Candidatus Absconditabacterales bacterium]
MVSLPEVISFVFIIITLAISIGLHEYAHAYVSRKLGDPTPQFQGRLTPNPLAHIDPIGFLMIFLVNFGWGKPVQVNPMYYRNPVQGELMVALAGPFTNLLLALAGACVIAIYSRIIGLNEFDLLQGVSYDYMIIFWLQFSYINIALAVFNMIPLPPLDGFRLIKTFFRPVAVLIEKYSFAISIVFLLAIALPGNFLGSAIGTYIHSVSSTLFYWIFFLVSQIF